MEETNFNTSFETRVAIKKALINATEEAKRIIKIKNRVVDPKTGGFLCTINDIDDKEIDRIEELISNSLGLVAEYVRDLKKF